MTITAKFPGTCPECAQPIKVGDLIEYRRGEKAKHSGCYKRYFEIPMGGGKIAVRAQSLAAAKAEAERLYRDGCDAEYCHDENCQKEHFHDVNCRCADCQAADEVD